MGGVVFLGPLLTLVSLMLSVRELSQLGISERSPGNFLTRVRFFVTDVSSSSQK